MSRWWVSAAVSTRWDIGCRGKGVGPALHEHGGTRHARGHIRLASSWSCSYFPTSDVTGGGGGGGGCSGAAGPAALVPPADGGAGAGGASIPGGGGGCDILVAVVAGR